MATGSRTRSRARRIGVDATAHALQAEHVHRAKVGLKPMSMVQKWILRRSLRMTEHLRPPEVNTGKQTKTPPPKIT